MSGGPVTIHAGEIARVVLDKPPVNALDAELVGALEEAVLELRATEPRAVVFFGGLRTLAAGGDIKWMLEHGRAQDRTALRSFLRDIQRLFDDIEALPMPTLAVIHGQTLGAGLELALACDLRVASEQSKMGFPEATLGLLPGAGGTQRLREAIGRGRALELLYTGRRIGAEEALGLGLVNRVAPTDDVNDSVEALLGEVLGSTSEAVSAIKACVNANDLDGRAAGLRAENSGLEELLVGEPALRRLEDFQGRS